MLCMESLSQLNSTHSRYVRVCECVCVQFSLLCVAKLVCGWNDFFRGCCCCLERRHTQNLGKGQHTSTINRFVICEEPWLLLLLLVFLSKEYTLHSFSLPPAALELIAQWANTKVNANSTLCVGDFCFHLFSCSLNEFVTQKKKCIFLFIQFVKFVLAFDMLCHGIERHQSGE